MLGDAISHSVLFGIVIAAILTGGRSLPILFLGAVLVGVLTAYLTFVLQDRARLQEDASIGVTFTWLFALGVIGVSLYANQIDIDQECVLFGEIAFLPFSTLTLGGIEWGPRGFYSLLACFVGLTLCMAVSWRRLVIVAFDSSFAQTVGIRTNVWHYLLMTAVSITIVASFEAVGAILVVAMLTIPANIGLLIARSVITMMLVAAGSALCAVFGGFLLARFYDASVSAAMAIVAGVLLLLVVGFRLIYQRFMPSQQLSCIAHQDQLVRSESAEIL